MRRTCVCANASNMSVVAREACIYTVVAITIAEYSRDMGFNISMIAEAMREISGYLREVPVNGACPASCTTKLSQSYERAERIKCLGSHNTAVFLHTSEDFNGPVTNTIFDNIQAFWVLDKKITQRRHYLSND